MTNKTGLEFKVGDAVVYPAHGVGKVAAVDALAGLQPCRSVDDLGAQADDPVVAVEVHAHQRDRLGRLAARRQAGGRDLAGPWLRPGAGQPRIAAAGRRGRADAHDPYYLYAASNLGSFIGLLAYPVLIEPALTRWFVGLATQADLERLDALQAQGIDTATLPFQASHGRTSLEYYDGFVFSFESAVKGPPVASGGRYDALTAVLGQGRSIPAVGGVIRPGLVAALKGA